MNIADHILARLADIGITHGMGVYGGAIAELFDAFTRQKRMQYVVMQHEQSCAFAAEGYAKAKGIPGFAFATSGPGGLNLVTGIANCYFDSTPCIFITGNVMSAFANPPGSKLRQLGFQECDIVSVVKPITKYAVKPDGPLHAMFCLETAIREATTGRPGPVLLDLPIDLQRASADFPVPGPELPSPTPYPPCADAATAFLTDLAGASRPGILVGGGAYRARAEIEAFAVAHNIPVFRTWNAQDVVTDDSPVYGGTVGTYGGPGRNFGVQNCDLLLVLGCRLSGRITGGRPDTFARGAKLWWVDVDADLMAHQPGRRPEVAVQADCGQFLDAIYEVTGKIISGLIDDMA